MRRIFSLSTSLRCSLRCDYCASGFHSAKAQRRPRIVDELGPNLYLRQLDRLPIPEEALINFHGPAEPLEDPMFGELANFLFEERRALRVYTNLLKPARLMRFLNPLSDARAADVEVAVSYHVASYQGDQRECVREGLAEVFSTCAFVRLMVPATPAALAGEHLEDDLRAFQARVRGRFQVSLIVLGGRHEDRDFPESYTDAELAKLARLSAMWGAWRPLPAHIANVRLLGGPLRVPGQLCYYPVIHAAVGIDGRIWNCGPENEPDWRLGDPIENLYHQAPVPCPHPVCTCKPRGVEYSLEARGIGLEQYLGLGAVPPWRRGSGDKVNP